MTLKVSGMTSWKCQDMTLKVSKYDLLKVSSYDLGSVEV